MSAPSTPFLMTPAETAASLGISPKTLRNWRAAGRGPRPTRLSAVDVRYDPADVAEWVKQLKRSGGVTRVPRHDGGGTE